MPQLCAFTPKHPLVQDDRIELDAEESHHLLRVLRACKGARILLLNGRGMLAHAVLQEAIRSSVYLRLVSVEKKPEPYFRITLAQAIPKGKNMEAIIRKATEIGIYAIAPLVTEHTDVRIVEERSPHKQERWQAIAIEACKQSANPWLPQIRTVAAFEEFLLQLPLDSLRIIASLEANSKFLRPTLPTNIPKDLCILVGPEGDFSHDEYRLAANHDFKPIRLTENVLRVETASLYALSVLDYELRLLG